MIVCTKCQHHNADTEKFCQRCGAFLEFSGKPLTDSPKLPPPPSGDDPKTMPTPVVPASVGDTQPVTMQSNDVAPKHPAPTGWATPAPDTVAVRPDEGGVDRAYVPTTITTNTTLAPGEVACPACGAGNPPSRTFCRSCGAHMAAAPVAVTAAPVEHSPTDRRKLYIILGAVLTAALVAALVVVLRPKDDNKGAGANPTTETSTVDNPTTTAVAVTVPATFPAQPSPVCGTAHYADVGTDPELAGWFLSGRLYAECAGERGNVVSKEGYVLFPSGPTCPALGQGLMFIVFDQPTAVRSVQLQPSPAPTRNYRWPVQARIIGYPDIVTNGPTRPAQGPGGQQITRTSAKPSGPSAWTADGNYDATAKTLTIANNNPVPVRAIELQLLQYGDTPGRSGSPDQRCAVHRIQVVG